MICGIEFSLYKTTQAGSKKLGFQSIAPESWESWAG